MGARLLSVSFAVLSLCLATACSSKKDKKATVVQTETIEKKEDVDYATISFDKGEVSLSEMDRRHLNELSLKLSDAGKVVDDIKILTWADKEVNEKKEASNSDIILARLRAENIKRYLDRTLASQETINFYNMAENPERYGNFLEKQGLSLDQARNDAGQINGQALVIIEYKNGPIPSQL